MIPRTRIAELLRETSGASQEEMDGLLNGPEDGLIKLERFVQAVRDEPGIKLADSDSIVDIVTHCPKCGNQHIDQVEFERSGPVVDGVQGCVVTWDNRPHKSHLCAFCGWVWRPADVYTQGVQETNTKGANDSSFEPDPYMVVKLERASTGESVEVRDRAGHTIALVALTPDLQTLFGDKETIYFRIIINRGIVTLHQTISPSEFNS